MENREIPSGLLPDWSQKSSWRSSYRHALPERDSRHTCNKSDPLCFLREFVVRPLVSSGMRLPIYGLVWIASLGVVVVTGTCALYNLFRMPIISSEYESFKHSVAMRPDPKKIPAELAVRRLGRSPRAANV